MSSRLFHRGTRLRAPKRPLSDAVKLEYVKWFVTDYRTDWDSGVVLQLFLFRGLDVAFEEAYKFTKDRERKQMDELMAAFMNPGSASVEEHVQHVQRVEGADLPKDDPSIRDLFGGPNWRTRVAEYFGFR